MKRRQALGLALERRQEPGSVGASELGVSKRVAAKKNLAEAEI